MERQQQQAQRDDYIAPMLRPGPEGISSFYRFLIVVAVFITAILTCAIVLWLAFCYAFNRPLFNSIWAGIVEIGNYVKILAFVTGGIGVLYIAGRAYTAIAARMPRPQIATFEETENLVLYGTYRARQFSHVKAPIAERRKVKKLIGTKIELAPPSIQQQIATGLIAVGMQDIMHGFEVKTMRPVRYPSSSSLTIGGTGSGKTRGNTWRMLQRVICEEASATVRGFAHVSICDPHAMKGDGIAPLVASIAPYIRLARTPAEIVDAARDFYNEMEARKAGRSAEQVAPRVFKPRHIFFDEWAALMDDKAPDYPYTAEERQLFLAVMLGCVREYRGFGGFGHISMQNPKQSNIGDITLRDDMPLLLVHKVSEGTCSFLYPSSIEAEKRKAVLKLKRRQCYVDHRTEEQQTVTEMPDVADEIAQDFLQLIQEAGMQPLQIARKQIAPPVQPSSPAGGGDISDREQRVLELLALLQSADRMPDLPMREPSPRTTQPLKEQIAEQYYTPTSSYRNTDDLSPNTSPRPTSSPEVSREVGREVGPEVDAEVGPEVEPIGRELVLEMLDKMTAGQISGHEFLQWAQNTRKPGGRKYSARKQTIEQLQQLSSESEEEE